MGAVTMFKHSDCVGKSLRVYYNPNDPVGGQYNIEDLEALGMENDSISSIMVPKGYTAYLYDEGGFTGLMETIEGQYIDDLTQELKCVDLPHANDSLSSLRIGKGAPAIGRWQAITSTESQTYSFHVGINYEHSELTVNESQWHITAALELGVKSKIIDAKLTVSGGYS